MGEPATTAGTNCRTPAGEGQGRVTAARTEGRKTSRCPAMVRRAGRTNTSKATRAEMGRPGSAITGTSSTVPKPWR